MKLAIPKILVAVIALASAVQAKVTTYKVTTDDRSSIEGHGYSKSGETEAFLIAATDRNKGQRLTPRVEREFRGKGLIRRDKGVYTFSTTCKIDAANYTTIFQLHSTAKLSEPTQEPPPVRFPLNPRLNSTSPEAVTKLFEALTDLLRAGGHHLPIAE